jgi:hypothetical protein
MPAAPNTYAHVCKLSQQWVSRGRFALSERGSPVAAQMAGKTHVICHAIGDSPVRVRAPGRRRSRPSTAGSPGDRLPVATLRVQSWTDT